MSANSGAIVGGILGAAAAIFLLVALTRSFLVVREKQQVVLERCGRFRAVLTPGVHCIVPFVDQPKRYSVRYYLDDPLGRVQLIERTTTRIGTQDEILDLPKQACISRDNASISLDVLLSYRVVNPKVRERSAKCTMGNHRHWRVAAPAELHPVRNTPLSVALLQAMVYSTQNLPRMLTKVLQVRWVTGPPVPSPRCVATATSCDAPDATAGASASGGGLSGRGLHH